MTTTKTALEPKTVWEGERKSYDELLLENENLRRILEGKWEPMDTAPQDGKTWILLWYRGFDRPIIAQWQQSIEGWMSFECRVIGEPKKWMPLPELPRLEGGAA
jgi:hypothetical protein